MSSRPNTLPVIGLAVATFLAIARPPASPGGEGDPGPMTRADRHREAVAALEKRGAVIKDYSVREIGVEGLLVRLKARHLDDGGRLRPELLPHLRQIDRLLLEVREAPLSDAGLRQIAALPRLEGLDVTGTRVRGAGLAHLASLGGLRLLVLSYTHVGDDALAHVGHLENLRFLALVGTRVSDDGLEHLETLSALRGLYLDDTRVSPAGVRRLRGVLKDADISGP